MVEEVRRYNFGLIANQSELAAKMHQQGSEFTEDLRNLAQDVLDIYRDLEELATDFKEVVQTQEVDDVSEILDDFRTCHDDLQELKPQLDRSFETEEASRLKLDDEFYLD